MKLPFLSQKKEDKEYFLALMLSSGKVGVILFEKNGERLLIAGTHSEEFTESLSELSSERLIELFDIAISDVERKIPQNYLLEKTIFSVPVGWVVEGKIVKDYLLKLKSLCEALSLTPVGFIVSIEAILAYLQKEEGAPVTAIFVELSHKHITTTIIKNGNILVSLSGEINESAVLTTEELLLQQEEVEVLPSKIILINYEHAKKSQQAFLSYHWSKKLPFLHLPQVEVLDPEIEAQSVVSGVAFEMGFSNLSVGKLPPEEMGKPVEIATNEEVADDAEVAKGEEKLSSEEQLDEAEETQHDSKLSFHGEAVGFFEGIDVFNTKQEKDEKIEEEKNVDLESYEASEPYILSKESTSYVSRPRMLSSFKIPRFPFPRSFGKTVLVYLILAAVVLGGFIAGYYYLYEKVSLTLYLEKKSVSKELNVSFSSDKDSSAVNKTVHISVLTASVDGSEEGEATGKKETGDKAKGEITVYNKTEDPKSFSKGATIIGPNSLEFNLAGDVSIASTSSFATSFSSAKVKIEAGRFGKEYNLPSSSNFQFKGVSTSDVFAKNESAFTGGTKQEIQIVSADDLSALQTKLIDKLSQKTVLEQGLKKMEGTKILSFPLEFSFDKKTFSKKEGQEATSVSLEATIAYKLGSYSISDLEKMAQEVDKSDLPEGYAYSRENSKIEVTDIQKDKEGNITGTIHFSSVYIPKVSTGEFAAKLSGKNADKIDSIVRIKGVSDDLVKFTRSLPFMPKIFPLNLKNIEVSASVL